MQNKTVFLSDLHLSAARPEITSRFLAFLQEQGPRMQNLFILGDLFDVYLGDDDDSSLNCSVKSALRRLHDAGVRVYFQAGNRDFLVGAAFARDTGVELLADYAVIDLAGAPTLITHGDLLCSDDVQYLQARVKVRAADWQRQALAKPLWLRRLYGRWYRLRSRLDKRGKAREIMDANTQTVLDEMRRHRVHRLIHGHTHRPGLHALELDGKPAQRHVLAAWEAQGQVLVWEAGQSSILTV